MANVLQRITGIFSKIRRPALRFGLIYGLILGVVEIILGLLIDFLQQSTAQTILSTLVLAAFLVAGYLAGQRAAQEIGKITSGIAAGLWTGLIGSLVEALLPFIFILIYLPTYVSGIQQDFKLHPSDYPGMKYADITGSYVLTGFAIDLLSNVFLYTLVALIGGALGGFLGKRRVLSSAMTAGSVVDEEPVSGRREITKSITSKDADEAE